MQRQRAEPDVRRARPDDRRIRGAVDPAHRDVGISARNMQALNPFAVDQSHLGDRRRLAQESQRVEPMAIVETLEPRQLDRPIHLGANTVEEGLNFVRPPNSLRRASANSNWRVGRGSRTTHRWRH